MVVRGVIVFRTFTLVVLVSIVLVAATNTSHAKPRISALVPRADDDRAHNTHGWALQRDPDRIVLMSPAKISLLARVEGKLRETDAQFDASGFPYLAIGNLGDSQFWAPETAGSTVVVFEAKRDPAPRLLRLKEFGLSRKFRATSGLPNGGVAIRLLPSGSLAAFLRRDEVSLVQWNAERQTIDSGGKAWDGDQKLHSCPIPRWTAACALGDGEALVTAQGLDASGAGHLTIFQVFPDTLKPLSVVTEKLDEKYQFRKGILLVLSLASSRDGKLVVGCGGGQATLFECTAKKDLIHRGSYCAAGDDDTTGPATGLEGLIRPRLCAAGDTWESIAFIDELAGGVSLCRYDSTTKKLVTVHTVDLNKLLSDKPGTAISITFAGRYLRIATTRYSLIELDFEMR
jgi:hypothetical protein